MNKTVLKLPGADDFFTQEAFKTLRTNLQFCGQDIRTVVITSCNENEGKTTVTLQLGKSLAELGKRVLVVDDVISTGGSLKALDALAEKTQCTIVGRTQRGPHRPAGHGGLPV